MSSSTITITSKVAAPISVHHTDPNPELDVFVVGERPLPDSLGIGTVVGSVVGSVVGTASGAVGSGPVVCEAGEVVGVEVLTPLGPTTPSGATSPRGCCGVGSKDTQPARGPRYTWGHACASAPRMVTS